MVTLSACTSRIEKKLEAKNFEAKKFEAKKFFRKILAMQFFSNDVVDTLLEVSGLSSNVSTDYSINAYVSWEDNQLVEISYFSQVNQWVKRLDCGSHSQHRWGLYNEDGYEIVQAVVKHNSCLKSIFNETKCQNCLKRDLWHKTCRTPSNTFYIIPLGSITECQSLLEPLILSRTKISDELNICYKNSVPLPIYELKTIKSNNKKRQQLQRLEKDIERDIVQKNRKFAKYKDTMLAKDSNYNSKDDLILEEEKLNNARIEQEKKNAIIEEEQNNAIIEEEQNNARIASMIEKQQKQQKQHKEKEEAAFMLEYLSSIG